MARFESLIERQRRERRRQRLLERRVPPEVVASEWEAEPLGSPGTRLWADIEHYFEFLDIARAEPVEPKTSRTVAGEFSTPHLTYLRFF